MRKISRRGIFRLGSCALAAIACRNHLILQTSLLQPNPFENMSTESELAHGRKLMRAALLQEVGEDKLNVWFNTLDLEHYAQGVLVASVSVKFIRDWINVHYLDEVKTAAQRVHSSVKRAEVALRPAFSNRPRSLSYFDAVS